MKVPKIFSAIAAAAILFATTADVSAEPRPINPEFATKSFVEGVDWKKQVITVIGEGVVPTNAVNYTQAKNLASKAAKADAYRKLAEIINGVRVEGETTVEKLLTTHDQVKIKVAATIKGAKIVDETFLSDGGYRVVVQMPLFASSNSLAYAVFEKNATMDPFPNPVAEIAPTNVPYSSSTPIKQRIEIAATVTVNVEEVTPNSPSVPAPSTPYRSPLTRMSIPSLDTIILQKLQGDSFTLQEPTYQRPVPNPQKIYETPATAQPVRKSIEEYASMAQGDYTGLIIDCRGLGLQPVMSPVVLNTNGTKIFGHKNLDIDKIISMGLADYVSDVDSVDRAGKNPLVVKAIAVQNFNSNPVLTIPDSNRVLIENYATKFLKELKVVFLFDD